jgi:hypothetical protein
MYFLGISHHTYTPGKSILMLSSIAQLFRLLSLVDSLVDILYTRSIIYVLDVLLSDVAHFICIANMSYIIFSYKYTYIVYLCCKIALYTHTYIYIYTYCLYINKYIYIYIYIHCFFDFGLCEAVVPNFDVSGFLIAISGFAKQ